METPQKLEMAASASEVVGYCVLGATRLPVLAVAFTDRLMYLETEGAVQLSQALYAAIYSCQDNRGEDEARVATDLKYENEYGVCTDIYIERKSGSYKRHADIVHEQGRRNRAHQVIMHVSCTILGPLSHLIGGTEEKYPVTFVRFFDQLVLPVLPHWFPILWQHGQKNGLIAPVPTWVVSRVWRISDDTDRWKSLFEELAKSKKLTLGDVQNAI